MTKYNQSEIEYLFKLIKQHYKVIGDKKTDSNANEKRKEVWDEIAANITKRFSEKSVAQLKQKWKDLQSKAKSLAKELRQNQIATGGGCYKEVKIDPLSMQVLELIGSQIAPITNPYDSDKVYETLVVENESTQDSIAIVPIATNARHEEGQDFCEDRAQIKSPSVKKEKREKNEIVNEVVLMKREEHELKIQQMKEEHKLRIDQMTELHQLKKDCLAREHAAKMKKATECNQPLNQPNFSSSMLEEIYQGDLYKM